MSGGAFGPHICVKECESALETAESVGETRSLCEPDSEFRQQVDACYTCHDGHSRDSDFARKLAELDDFLEFCDILVSTVTGVFVSDNGHSVTIVYGVPASTVSETDTSPADPATSSTGATEAVPADGYEDSGGLSQGTLAGAIAGPVFALLLIVAIGAIWWRKRRWTEVQTTGEKTGPFEKPMLHSDCVPTPIPYELGGGAPAYELEGDAPAPMEVVGSEVPVQELPESDNKDEKTATKANGGGEES